MAVRGSGSFQIKAVQMRKYCRALEKGHAQSGQGLVLTFELEVERPNLVHA